MPRSNKSKVKAAEGPEINTGAATAAKKATDKAKVEAPAKGFDDKPVHTPVKTGETVTIACKIPGGLKLRFFRKHERMVDVKGGREIETSFQIDPSVKAIHINGPSHPIGSAPRFQIVGGAALTRGVPKDAWDRWCHENAQHPALINGQVFASPSVDHVVGRAREEKANLSGMQPMAQGVDPRTPRRRNRKGQLTDEAAITTLEDDAA